MFCVCLFRRTAYVVARCSEDVESDLAAGGFDEAVTITPPLPFAIAHHVLGHLDQAMCLNPARAHKTASQILRHMGERPLHRPVSVCRGSAMALDGETLKAISQALSGRALLLREAAQALDESGIVLGDIRRALGALAMTGCARALPSLEILPTGARKCNRCNSLEAYFQITCAICGRARCAMCSVCRSMGISRECEPLYIFADRRCAQDRAVEYVEAIALSPAQVHAEHRLVSWLQHESTREFLVWAVCGAGKTEVSFGAMARTLEAGGRVMYAAPRTDVVMELHPRISRAFPGERIACLHGRSPDRYADAGVLVATAHQAMRFAGRFDLVILDEADAYPYYGSDILPFAIRRAMSPGGRLVYMTATPTAEHIARVRRGSLPCARISARHHGRPLPVPEFITNSSTQSERLDSRVVEAISQTCRAGRPLFVYVPKRAHAKNVAELIERTTGIRALWSHAQDTDRHQKRERFSRGEHSIMVSTSILERGITVPGAHVLVMQADAEKVMDARALVQMAGRAGRSAEYPDGRVWFACERVTRSMVLALQQIREMNEDARTRGLVL